VLRAASQSGGRRRYRFLRAINPGRGATAFRRRFFNAVTGARRTAPSIDRRARAPLCYDMSQRERRRSINGEAGRSRRSATAPGLESQKLAGAPAEHRQIKSSISSARRNTVEQRFNVLGAVFFMLYNLTLTA
jgi:hypothetical protein